MTSHNHTLIAPNGSSPTILISAAPQPIQSNPISAHLTPPHTIPSHPILSGSGSTIAAHCCYALAEVALQSRTSLDSPRLHLLGFDPTVAQLPTVGAIQASEIYAYFRKRALATQPDFVRNVDFSAASLPYAQLLYAHQLCDFGCLDQVCLVALEVECLKYVCP